PFVGAVGEQHAEVRAIRRDPEGGAGPAGVAVSERSAAGRLHARRLVGAERGPAEGAPTGAGLLAEQLGDEVGAEDAHAVEFAAARDHADEAEQVGGGREEPGVAVRAAEPAGERVGGKAAERFTGAEPERGCAVRAVAAGREAGGVHAERSEQ